MTTFLSILFIITLQCALASLLMCGGASIVGRAATMGDIALIIILMALIGLLTVLAWGVGRP